MSGELELDAAEGYVEASLRAEFPGLTLRWVTVEARPGRSTPDLKRRLRELSNRFRGESVVAMRTQPIPRAYRVFFRQIGLDPDVTRVPSEQAAVSRLLHGRLQSRDAIADALLVALVETGVPVWALDADAVDVAGLGIRPALAGERLGAGSGGVSRKASGEGLGKGFGEGDAAGGAALSAGQLVVADPRCVHAVLFGEIAPGHGPGPDTRRLTLYAVGVDGVPRVHAEEALWIAADLLPRP